MSEEVHVKALSDDSCQDLFFVAHQKTNGPGNQPGPCSKKLNFPEKLLDFSYFVACTP